MSANECHKKVIIVGAGIAGLSAALKLYECGVNDFVILEAQSRIGGRILTVEIENGHIELGVSRFQSDILAFEIAKENNLLVYRRNHNNNNVCDAFRSDAGRQIDDEFLKTSISYIKQAKKEYYSNYFYRFSQSKENFMKLRYQKFVEEHTNLQLDLYTINQVFGWCLSHLKMSVTKKSLQGLTERVLQEKEPCFELKFGFQSLPSLFADRLPKDVIKLHKHVVKIDYNDDYVSVLTADGDHFCADHLIMTSSIGYLKENVEKLFQPPLPKRKIAAIKNVKFRTVNKVFLETDEPLGIADRSKFHLIWTRKDYTDLPVWVYDISSIETYKIDNLNYVLLWIEGKGAETVEDESPVKVASVCITVFKLFVKNSNITKARRIIASRWRSNEYFRGSVSEGIAELEKDGTTFNDLTEPISKEITKKGTIKVMPVILFAGEAMDLNYCSTINGALNSGLRVAQAIIDSI